MNKHLNRWRLRTVSALVACACVANAWAVDPFTVSDIRVEGLLRVEPGTVFASLPLRVGDVYNDDKGAAAIRALFALGLFKDVRVEVNGTVLVVVVEERPTVAEVDVSGSREFDKDTLKRALRDIGVLEGRAYDQGLVDRAEQEIKRQYINRSLYGAEVVTTITPTERNRVNLSFAITEGEPAKIREIRIVGARAFSESTLKGQFDLQVGGWLNWYTKADRYARSKLNADLETLRSYYLNRGYLEFRIDSTQVAISPDKQDITITINITEGNRYVVSGVRLEGNYLGREEEFKSLVRIRPGESYNADLVTDTVKRFTELFGNFGYAFARVEALPEIDRVNNRVTFVLQGDPQRRVYVRRINISGNTRTRDEVIRRELRQFESSWYDGDRIRRSRDRVDRLGFFREVNFETVDVAGSPDQVDLNLVVVEKPTGSLQIGAGFSSAEKFAISFGVRQENAFGSGNYLGVEVNTSKFNRAVVINSVDPYFTKDGVSRTFDLYHRAQKPYNQQGGNYQLKTTGGGIRFGVPFTEYDMVYVGAGLEGVTIVNGTNIPAAYLAYQANFGSTSVSLPLTVGWSRDDRDSAIAPNRGRFQRLFGEWAVAGDARYLRGNYQLQQYVPLSRSWTVAFNGELGWGKGLEGRPFPVFKNFYSGGLGSVRGFEQSTLGPRDVTGLSIGGARKITLNGEVIAPVPGAGNDRTLRIFGFVDVGNVYGENDKVDFSTLRASTGVGVSWTSPLGPLRFAFAVPVRKFPGDRIQKLQFQIGSSF
ncbi:MAG: outer membrane protein assembly factor BamA [Betaproteobacteria bacterium]|nr:outer membrane protein assembly factor BamA [Betaproteobacteria bacterium]